jgi:hypothetical protein
MLDATEREARRNWSVCDYFSSAGNRLVNSNTSIAESMALCQTRSSLNDRMLPIVAPIFLVFVFRRVSASPRPRVIFHATGRHQRSTGPEGTGTLISGKTPVRSPPRGPCASISRNAARISSAVFAI